MVFASVVMKIALCIGGVLLVVGSTLVTIAALFPPKEYTGEDKKPESDGLDQSIADVDK